MKMKSEIGSKHFEALVAATLALMTHFAEAGCPHLAQRIYDNLLHICDLPDVPWELRTVLAKLTARWTLLREIAVAASRSGTPLH